MKDLKDIRIKINEIDEKMAKLFEERMNASKEVASYKISHGMPIFDENREKELIEKNKKYIENNDIRDYYVNFIKETINISKKYQSRLMEGLKVGYSGVEGAFAHIASMKLFPNSQYVNYPDFASAYKAVESGECDTCILPLENSYAGDVAMVLDLLFSGSLFINQMIELDVVHNICVKKGTNLKDIKTIISHPQALAQCTKYIEKHNFKVIEAENTAVSAKLVSESDDMTIAAIASEESAALYGLDILESNINSSRNNTTRFGAFSRSLNINSSNNESGSNSIIVFTVKNEAGALAKTLNIIGSHGFNMRSLRSRPMKELIWNYYFYVELEGNINTQEGKDMLRALNIFCDRLKVVGSYKH